MANPVIISSFVESIPGMNYLRGRLLILSLLFSINLSAQQNHFIYIQTENKQPFYIKLDKQVLSSSVSGYIIMPRLKDGEYTFLVGFPKNEIPEQKISCTINGKDLGYILKDFGSKGWGLFNMQTMEVVMSGTTPSKKDVLVETKTDDFSNLLSNVVNDPSIKQKEVQVNKEPVKEVTEKPAEVTPIILTDTAVKVVEEPVARTSVNRVLLSTNSDGAEMIYVDKDSDKSDTIRVFMPSAKKPAEELVAKPDTTKAITPATEENKVVAEVKTNVDSVTTKVEEKLVVTEVQPPAPKTEEKKEVAIDTVKVESNKDVAVAPQVTESAPVAKKEVTPMINSDCKSIANDDDFIKLRKKMVGGDNEDEMITIAKKAFKAKCYSVEQVKNLSVLFLKDEGKYSFFDAAYPFVSDSHYFSTLQSQLTDPYYITRFQAMIRH